MSGHQYIPRPVATVLPNVLGFTYNGVRYEIFIDVGEHDEAYQLAADEDWEALSKWPKYTGQKHDYTEYNRLNETHYGEHIGN